MLADQAKNLGLDVRPRDGAVLRNGDIIGAEEDGGDAVDIEELGSKWRRVGWREGGARVHVFEEGRREVFREDAGVGIEFHGLARC